MMFLSIVLVVAVSSSVLAVTSNQTHCWDVGEYVHCFPTRFVIGAAKCGTTAAWHAFQTHRQLAVHDTIQLKESNFVNWRYNPKLTPKQNSKQYAVKMPRMCEECLHSADFTPRYISTQGVAERLRKMAMSVGVASKLRFVAFLRNPVDMMISYYHYNVFFLKRESRTAMHEFLTMVENDMKKYAHCRAKVVAYLDGQPLGDTESCWQTGGFSISGELMHYMPWSFYFIQLHEWMSNFDRSQFHIVRFEDVTSFAKPSIYDQICTFFEINVQAFPPPVLDARQQAYTRPNTSWDVPPDLRMRLEEFYEPFNQALERLFGFPPW